MTAKVVARLSRLSEALADVLREYFGAYQEKKARERRAREALGRSTNSRR
jgi:hypothetical protein